MKKYRIIILTLLFCGLSFSAEAQFLKNLKNKVIDKSKDAIINKTADKVADNISDKVSDQIAGAVNSALGANWEGLVSPLGNIKDIESLPASYSFDYIYSMKISTPDGELPIDYYLSKSKPYMGAKFNIANEMVMIFDDENKALITFIGDKAIATELAVDSNTEDLDDYKTEDYKITNLPNKTFLGYDCIGRLIENNDSKMTVYVAQNTDVSFADMFKSKHAQIPGQMKSISKKDEGGMMMYAEVIDKTNKKNSTATIECIAFEKSDKVIKIR